MSARILVVDDNEANRRLMQAKLEARYYSVQLAKDGPEALEKAADGRPQIILLDVMMPGMDGYEVCTHLKSNPITQHIPIVMLTALSETEHRIRGLEVGADDFLSKPVDDFALLRRLDALTRYNAVAEELRKREANSQTRDPLSDAERRVLSGPGDIMIIDGRKQAADRLARPLLADGHSVITLQNEAVGMGLDALEMVILSLSNQSYDPLRLCALFKTMEAEREISVIVTHERGEQNLASEALRLGANDTITVPIDDQELKVRVRTQLKRSRYLEVLRQRVDRGIELSVIDQLTELYNRRYMLATLEKWMKRSVKSGPPVSVVSFDIDHFKKINDEFGHETGDLILREFADRIRANCRPKDIACRVGGEEFLVILPETPPQVALQCAERIRTAIAADPFEVERSNSEVLVTVSAGVSTFAGKEDTIAELLHRADRGLYRAKELGRNRIETLAA